VKSVPKRIFDFLASLKLAVILLVAFAILLSWATILESKTSTENVQRLIYQTRWFDFLLFVLGVNVFCAAMSRFPWKKRHTGFVITHLGILIILAGSMVTRKYGIEGQLILQEGQTSDSILINETVLSVKVPRMNVQVEYDPWFLNRPIPEGKEIRYPVGETGIVCYVERYLLNPQPIQRVTGGGTPGNPAIQLGLHQAGMNETSTGPWLIARDPAQNTMNLGQMAQVQFRRVESPAELEAALAPPTSESTQTVGQVLLHQADGTIVQTLLLEDLLKEPKNFEWNQKQYTVTNKEFLPRASIQDGQLINRESGAFNPAIRFTLEGPEGTEEHLAFSEFPDFGSIHGKANPSGLSARLIYPNASSSASTNLVTLLETPDGQLHYRATNTAGGFLTGTIQIGKPFQTTWPQVMLSVQQYIPDAQVTEEIIDQGLGAAGPHNNPALQVRVEHQGQSVTRYVSYDNPVTLLAGDEPCVIEFGRKRHPLGFAIHLIDFQAPRYPGTNRPAKFQSLVKLIDPQNQVEEETLIYMNNPLGYNQFLVYQSSYIEGKNGMPDTSIFSVARAPGTPIIYVGSTVLCLGMVIMFISRRKAPTVLPPQSIPPQEA